MIRTLLVALVPACALTSKAPPREPRHFAPEIAAEAGIATTPCARVRLGRVVPSATLRFAIVRRISPVEIEAYETLRWTEPPEAYARRALANGLFATHPLEQAVTGAAVVLDVELMAFEEIGSGAARVEFHYELRDDHRVITRGTSRVERTAATPGIEAVVAAIGTALAAASDEVAGRVVVATCRH